MTRTETLVIDASVAVKWYVPERGSDHASALLGRGMRLLAPDLLVAEFGNALWKKTRRGELSPSEAQNVVSAFTSAPPIALRPSVQLLSAALEIATGFDRSVYDALYLALAVAETCSVVTADDRLVRSLHRTKLRPFVRRLGGSQS